MFANIYIRPLQMVYQFLVLYKLKRICGWAAGFHYHAISINILTLITNNVYFKSQKAYKLLLDNTIRNNNIYRDAIK